MADFVVLRNFQTSSFRLKAGDVVDSAHYDLDILQTSGLQLLAFQTGMLPVIKQYLEERSTDDAGMDLVGGLVAAAFLGGTAAFQAGFVVPEEISDSTGDVGTASDFSREDHVHAHGDRGGGTLHPVAIASGAAGFTSGADKQKLDDTETGAELNTGTNVGAGTGFVFRDKTGVTLNLKSLIGGTRITATDNTDDITLATDAELNTGANVGAGAGTIFRDKTSEQFNFRSITGTGGITASVNVDVVEIDGSGVGGGGGATDEVIIEVKADFPAPSGGTITLANNTRYLIRGVISIGTDRIVAGVLTPLLGRSRRIDQITYTGTGAAITVPTTAVEGLISNIKIEATSGSAVDVNNAANFEATNVTLTADTLGDINASASINLYDVFADGFGDGLSFSGTNGQLTVRNAILTQTTGTGGNVVFDLGSATFSGVRLNLLTARTATAGFALSGLATGGNINTGGFGEVSDSDFEGSGTALENITEDDLQWWFRNVIGVLESAVIGQIQQNTGSVVKTISGSTKLDFTSTLDTGRRVSQSSAMTMRYDALQDRQCFVWAHLNAQRDSAPNVDYVFEVKVNGSVVLELESALAASDLESITISGPLPVALTDTDTIELFANGTGDVEFFSTTIHLQSK